MSHPATPSPHESVPVITANCPPSRRERLAQRLLDALPGLLTWLTLFFCITGALLFPRTLLALAALMAVYTALRFSLSGMACLHGLRRIRTWARTDWRAHYAAHATAESLPWETVHHIVIIPNYREPLAILQRSLDRLAATDLAAAQMSVVLAMEASEPESIAKAEHLCAAYTNRFASIDYTLHPAKLPGEIRCKSANLAWAAGWITHKLLPREGHDRQHVVLTTMDADTLWHPQYFAALTALFALDPHRYRRFWQAPIRYHGNVWQISPPMRMANAYGAAFELAYLSAPWAIKMPFSSYSLSLTLLESSGSWDGDVIADEWHMYIKAFFDGSDAIATTPVMLPFYANATTGDTVREAVLNRYRQTLRHAWGSKEIGYLIAQAITHHKAAHPWQTLRLLLRVSHDVLLSGAGWILVTLGSQLPVLLNPDLLRGLWQNPTFWLLQAAIALIAVLSLAFWQLDVRLRPPRTAPVSRHERVLGWLALPLLPLLTFIFLALPVLDAQTRLLLGKSLDFHVSRKL